MVLEATMRTVEHFALLTSIAIWVLGFVISQVFWRLRHALQALDRCFINRYDHLWFRILDDNEFVWRCDDYRSTRETGDLRTCRSAASVSFSRPTRETGNVVANQCWW